MKQYLLATLVLAASIPSLAGCGGNVGKTGDSPSSDSPDLGGPENEGSPPVSACDGEASVGVGRWRRLTAKQYTNTVRDLLGMTPEISGFLGDTRTGPFTTNALQPLQELDVDSYATVAQTTAKKVSENLGTLTNCNAATVGEDKCATQFIKDLGSRAYRRPLTAEEEAGFQAVYAEGKSENYAAGIRMVVEAALQSPNFLYMVEPGALKAKGIRRLTGYEVATRLSYLLTGSMPDATVFAAARNGELNNAAGIKATASRLMESAKFAEQSANFHTQLLGVDALAEALAVSKPADKFPTFDAAMRTAMLDEPRRFVEYVMNKGDGSIEELLTASYVLPTGPLENVYGNPRLDRDGRAVMSDGSRTGLLTLASTQAVHPRVASPNGAVNRGYMVRHEFLCQEIPPAPGGIDFTPPPNAAQLSAQELLREHQENATCKACHELMDSIGFAFESYDQIGAFRTKDERGNTIDTTGEITGFEGDGKFRNAGELARKLAKSPEVRACMSTQWFRFALGRDPTDADACTQQLFTDALAKGKGNLKDGLFALVTSDSFRFKGEE